MSIFQQRRNEIQRVGAYSEMNADVSNVGYGKIIYNHVPDLLNSENNSSSNTNTNNENKQQFTPEMFNGGDNF
jgi:hypothetical protein